MLKTKCKCTDCGTAQNPRNTSTVGADSRVVCDRCHTLWGYSPVWGQRDGVDTIYTIPWGKEVEVEGAYMGLSPLCEVIDPSSPPSWARFEGNVWVKV